MPDNPSIDPSALARLNKLGGSDFVKKMIDLFLDEAPKRLAAAREGERGGDLEAVAEATHALKSSARNFGAVTLSQIATKLEMLARQKQAGEISALLGELENEFAEDKAWLEAQRNSFDA